MKARKENVRWMYGWKQGQKNKESVKEIYEKIKQKEIHSKKRWWKKRMAGWIEGRKE